MPYLTHLFVYIATYIILAIGLNLSIGFTGLLNLGHVAFLGIGAYTSALLTLAGVPFPLAFLAAGIFAALFAPLLMYLTKNVRGDYLALSTLGFGLVAHAVFLNWISLTHGPLGIPGIPRPDIFGFVVSSRIEFFLFTVTIAGIVLFIIWLLTSSRYGTLLGAIRDDELAVAMLGKNVMRLKIQSLAIAAFLAGIAGSLSAHYITYIDPTAYDIPEIIFIVSVVIVGGLASLRGTVVATILLVLLPEALRFVDLPSSVLGPSRQLLYAVFLLLILLYRPRGLFGTVELE
ncbi:branched-chain amino acid ABC transporter permease [Candidatus Uhrbacteria bacterium CG10_big_fil_rev_8_21_14_0_10_48_11]|uniref:Branched-chain amino acid ABC transporter permease n=1 Tax=Candidatus Uhrbacteria bacterium CG10_big_fil_rev_8_21_14_0_10_48_11 TaxID=1975037 RepID=A0A2M8LEM8_9BACT|nr:MAG: branched-chain amino acid ABC transporter permease [Candidatus Uhrbacteria bacterium CG10_big_fil_rev_8_21_14_0_10_48_11]